MPLVTSNKMMHDAQVGGYAVGAFNIENMEMAQAVIAAAEEMSTPVIIQTTPSTVKYGSPKLFYSIVSALANDAKVAIALHLDHGESYEMAHSALLSGYTSIMIDGSPLSFEENIALTSKVVAESEKHGIPVEAELGKVGGKEDDLDGGAGNYTDPQEAKEFVQRTGIFSLAVAIGTAHGVYNATPKLDIDRLEQIRSMVDIPLVLHGASGLTEKQIKQCITRGICKVNIATELRKAYSDGIKEYYQKDPDAFDPKKPCAAGRDRVKQTVIDMIKVLHH